MSDVKSNIKQGIDNAAAKAKEVAGKVVDKSKEAAAAVGKKVEETGKKIKDTGK
jgi:hypothetical protein